MVLRDSVAWVRGLLAGCLRELVFLVVVREALVVIVEAFRVMVELVVSAWVALVVL